MCQDDTSQQLIALCVLVCNRILSLQQVAQILSDLIFCNMLQRQKFSQKFSSTYEAIYNWSPYLYTPSDLLPRLVAATCRLVCTELKSFIRAEPRLYLIFFFQKAG